MKIVFISPMIYPCCTGGLEVFNYYIIKELASQGHTIWILTSCDYDWANKNIHRINIRNLTKHKTYHSGDLSIIFEMIKLKNKVDILHVPCTNASYFEYPVLFINKLLKIPYIIIMHSGGVYELNSIRKLFFKNAKAVIAVSENIKNEYEHLIGREIHLVPPLIPFSETKNSKNEMKKKYGFTPKDKILLSVGSIKKIKGSDILLDAFLKFGKDYIQEKNLKLLFVGDGPMKQELEKKVDENNLHKYIKFYGTATREKIPEIYKLADIYIIPSLFEGTPISLLEAKYNGLPIIGANVKGINVLITHRKNGLLFEKENSDDLKSKTIELINDPIQANRLGSSAKNDFFQEYKFEDMICDHIKIYKECL
jgi:glycosyltransferase involved in cell wall biosynthesis